jgi:hypothetical protein
MTMFFRYKIGLKLVVWVEAMLLLAKCGNLVEILRQVINDLRGIKP